MLSLLHLLLLYMCCGINSISVETNDGSVSTALLFDFHHCAIDLWIGNDKPSSYQHLPLDIIVSINGFLKRKDIHSLMRSNQKNLHFCQQYIRRVLFDKFDYLLNHNESKINIKHLLNIPFVNPIIMNASYMPFYFGRRNRTVRSRSTSSMYIGIDRNTNYGFISFWLKKISCEYEIYPQFKIITVVFNATNIHCIYITHAHDLFSFKHPIKAHSLLNETSDADDIKAINDLLRAGKIRCLSDDNATWCLNQMWHSCMFWLRIKDAFLHPARRNIFMLLIVILIAYLVLIGVAIQQDKTHHK